MNPEQMTVLRQVVAAAVASERATVVNGLPGFPAELSTAQCLLESSWLRLMPPGSNNCFGIKDTDRWEGSVYSLTTEWEHGQPEKKRVAFEKYPTLADCFADHSRLLMGQTCPHSVYRPMWERYLRTHDLDRFIAEMGPRYASDPFYTPTILQLVRGPNITREIAAARAATGG